MNYANYRISLDLQAASSQYSLPMKQGDKSRKIYITFRENGVPYELSEDVFAVFTAKKPDGNPLYNNCIREGDQICYEVTEQTTSAVGRLDCEILLYGDNGGLIGSARFNIIVDTRAISDEEIESSAEYSALTELMPSVIAATEVANTAAENANESAENAREAEEERVVSEAERVAAENAREAAEEERKATHDAMSSNTANAVKGGVISTYTYLNISDASPITHKLDLCVTGKQLIPYPFNEISSGASLITNGVTLTDNGDGTVRVSGKASKSTTFYLHSSVAVDLPAGQYIFYGLPYSGTSYSMTISLSPSTGSAHNIKIDNTTPYKTAAITKPINKISVYINIPSNTTVNTLVSPMLEPGEFPSGFQSYLSDLSGCVVGYRDKNSSVPEYLTPGIDGKITGVYSKYPTMYFTTDGDALEENRTLRLLPLSILGGGYIEFKTDREIPLNFFNMLSYTTQSGTPGVNVLVSRMYYNGYDYTSMLAIKLSELSGGAINGYVILLYNSSYSISEILYSTTTIPDGIPGLQKIDTVGWQKDKTAYAATDFYGMSTDFNVSLNGRYMNVYSDMYRNNICIRVGYNKDVNKVIETLTQAIISLGGNV